MTIAAAQKLKLNAEMSSVFGSSLGVGVGWVVSTGVGVTVSVVSVITGVYCTAPGPPHPP